MSRARVINHEFAIARPRTFVTLNDCFPPVFMDSYLPQKLALTGATGALGFAFLRRHFQRDPKLQASLLVRKSSSAFQGAPFQNWLRENESRITLVEGDMRSLGAD